MGSSAISQLIKNRCSRVIMYKSISNIKLISFKADIKGNRTISFLKFLLFIEDTF